VTLQIDLLEESFDLVVIRGDDLTAEFYRCVFARAPQLQDLFAHVEMSLQRLKFISTLVVLRQSLRDLEALRPELEALGARHADYGARPEHYSIIQEALLDAMATVGGDRWTPAYTAAWAEAYTVVQEAMLRGAAAAQAGTEAERA
jgi:hemoglobin-like flavoprotein